MPSKGVPAATPIEESFRLRTLRDLLDARDAYHYYLVNQPHVLATAVGLYLVRDEEADKPTTAEARLALAPGVRPPRGLGNSHVQPWSWPCVLVFVDAWLDDKEIARNPDAMVPRRLYLPDGRVVPTCVVYAPPSERPPDLEQHLNLPSLPLGGGYVCLSTVQAREHVGSIACLVTDGDKTYALTNRHVAGPPGRVLRSIIAGADTRIGCSASVSVSRRLLTELYPGFAGARVEVAIDAGLIDVDDVNDWTTQVFGIGQLDEMLDVGAESLTLGMVGTRVRAFGAASGPLAGEIIGLFYRYRTVGGAEYVADALIAPRGDAPLATQPGDSGTLWVFDPEDGAGDGAVVEAGKPAPKATPLAVQWGGHVFVRGASTEISPYALATFLSNVCRTLDVELVRDWNLGHDQYWGAVGHYTIGAKACELPDTRLLPRQPAEHLVRPPHDRQAGRPGRRFAVLPARRRARQLLEGPRAGRPRPRGPEPFRGHGPARLERRRADVALALPRRPCLARPAALDRLLPGRGHDAQPHGVAPVPSRPAVPRDRRKPPGGDGHERRAGPLRGRRHGPLRRRRLPAAAHVDVPRRTR
jgi:hypothetical protein